MCTFLYFINAKPIFDFSNFYLKEWQNLISRYLLYYMLNNNIYINYHIKQDILVSQHYRSYIRLELMAFITFEEN